MQVNKSEFISNFLKYQSFIPRDYMFANMHIRTIDSDSKLLIKNLLEDEFGLKMYNGNLDLHSKFIEDTIHKFIVKFIDEKEKSLDEKKYEAMICLIIDKIINDHNAGRIILTYDKPEVTTEGCFLCKTTITKPNTPLPNHL